MIITESIRQAVDSLKANKLRSALTMLGIAMGVFSVITIVAIGNAAETYINSQFERIGANIISITYRERTVSEQDWLTLSDLEIVKKSAPEIKNIATMVQRTGTLRVGSKTRDALVYGVSSQYKSFIPLEMETGRFISETDISSSSRVVVVDGSFAQKYFKRLDVVGETVQLKNTSGETFKLRIIGVTGGVNDLLSSVMNNEHVPAFIYMPISTVQNFYANSKKLANISISVIDDDRLKEIGERVVRTLELRHGGRDLYMAQNSADQQKILSDVVGVISAVLLVIAIITLIVGGIGIINILLVSVTERIREIGVRKAIGAKRSDIIMQFLTEAILMTGFSGLIGILAGITAGNIISSIIKIPPVINFNIIILSFIGSITLGLLFGVYPAKRAADLDPIQSLRYE